MPKPLKIAILYDTWEGDPPEPGAEPEPEPEKESPKKKKAGSKKKRKKRNKLDREEIFDALEKLGHDPTYVILDGHKPSLLALAKYNCDLIFNLTESFAGNDTNDKNIAAFLELLGTPYTGCGSDALFLAQDKALAKKLFDFHGIKTPDFATSFRGRVDHAHNIKFPLIVKPTSEDGSIGIDVGSVVENVKELMERIHYIHEEFDSPVLIEEFIEGREIYGAILGNESVESLPLIELDLSKLPKGTPKIATADVKFMKDTEVYKVTKSGPVEDLAEETVQKLYDTSQAAYRALKMRDFARIDMRLTPKGEVYVIEANPNPWLWSSAEFAMAAKQAGRSYTDMIGEIVELALARYR
ncbi:MAG: D-alanine--D-alanine ligase family protein [Terriglobales bacterium]